MYVCTYVRCGRSQLPCAGRCLLFAVCCLAGCDGMIQTQRKKKRKEKKTDPNCKLQVDHPACQSERRSDVGRWTPQASSVTSEPRKFSLLGKHSDIQCKNQPPPSSIEGQWCTGKVNLARRQWKFQKSTSCRGGRKCGSARLLGLWTPVLAVPGSIASWHSGML